MLLTNILYKRTYNREFNMECYIKEILERFANLEEVKSIAIGGSSAAKTDDNKSDIDVYIFSQTEIPIYKREKIIKPISSKYEIGGEYFGSGDEFFADKLNRQLDVMYWNINWFESVVENTWFKYYPQNGYTTCFLFTLKNFNIIYDKDNWLTNLQQQINTPYPQELKQNIIKRNLMLMKEKPFASYYEQIQKAIERKDSISINHRISAFLASYFDVIFAANEQLHPGEKRLIQYVINNCKIIPNNFEQNLSLLFTQQNNELLVVLDNIYEECKNILLTDELR